ncbi:Calmodulin [Leucoagaricus sp. SymC.cos]|nr:Calmodulin [Leucoagaricus sp. SymC.cos]
MDNLFIAQLTDQISAYKDSFQVFDTDGNGTISPQELGSLMRSFGQNPTAAQLDTIMNNIDSDKNGSIDFDEFVGLMAVRSKATGSDPDEESDLREAFEYFDKNGDGSINVDELKIVMRNIGVYLTDEELDLMMKEADEDGNGVIDFQEFRRVILLPASANSEPVRVNN